jgi:hypothetical protein
MLSVMLRVTAATILVLAALPAAAWEAGRDGAVCTLTHVDPVAGEVRLTHDPAGPLYTITVTRADPWPEAPIFGIRFTGGTGLVIRTERHSLSPDRRALTVSDRGFGNVLLGLSRNQRAIAFAGSVAVPFSLTGAAPEVAEFAACEVAPAV